MPRRFRPLLWMLLVAQVLARVAYAEVGPLQRLPMGWTYLPNPGVDLWRGVYHDSISGAYVTFGGDYRGRLDLSPPPERRLWGSDTSDVVTQGVVGGVPYELVRAQHPRARELEYIERTSPELEPQHYEKTLPPPGCSPLLRVTFLPNSSDYVWWFTATVCDDQQEFRVEELLLGELRLRLSKVGPDLDRGNFLPERRTIARFEDVAIGAKVDDVILALGPLASVSRVGTDGFLLEYYIWEEGVEDPRNAAIEFGRTQTVTKKSLSRADEDEGDKR